MKKKWLVLIGIVVIGGGGILTTALKLINQDKNLTTVTHTQEWVLTATDLKEITVSGLDQELLIDISQGDAPDTQVIFSGETTPEIQNRLEKVKSSPDKLNLDVMEQGLSISIKGKATDLVAKLQIILGKEATLASFKHASIFANTQVTLPADLPVTTYPKTKDGQINTVEDDPRAKTSLKIVSDSGDITIQKR